MPYKSRHLLTKPDKNRTDGNVNAKFAPATPSRSLYDTSRKMSIAFCKFFLLNYALLKHNICVNSLLACSNDCIGFLGLIVELKSIDCSYCLRSSCIVF